MEIAQLSYRIKRNAIYRALSATLVLGFALPYSVQAAAETPQAVVSTAVTSLRTMPLFEEPLIPTKQTSAAEDSSLLAAAQAYRQQTKPDDLHLFTDFLDANPQSGWRVSLLTNLGLSYYHYGYFSKAIDAWEQAWTEGRDIKDSQTKVMVDRAIGELVRMHARLGHSDRLAELLKEVGDRPVSGPATEAVTGAKEGLWMMRNEPGVAYLCGPKALKNLMLSTNHSLQETQFLDNVRSGPHGVSLAQVGDLAKQAKLPYTLAYRESKQDIPIPSLVHWKVNHFAAVVAKEGDRYHLKDPTFGTDLWVTKGAFDSESSGYFLLPQNQLANGFREVALSEANNIRGMGYTTNNDPFATRPYDDKGKPPCSNPGMCGYNFHSMVVSLNLSDTPVGYKPPKGPSVFFTLTYNQREANQPSTFNFFNVSPKWTLNWLSYIQDDPTAAGASVMRYVAGGGSLNYAGFNSTSGAFTAESYDGSVLTRVVTNNVVSYQRTQRDGSIEVYAQSDGATAYPRRLFLTKKIDSAGNAVTLTYDTQLRLTSITDASGKITSLIYAASNPLLVTKITDPFGRAAQLSYDASGRLQQITDTLGLTSQFAYDSSSLINSMTTPYGTTTFAYGGDGSYRWLEITDPLNQTERAEYRHSAPGIPFSESIVPAGMVLFNAYVDERNTFFWDKSIYPITHTDYTQAEVKHWLHDSVTTLTAPVLESIKHPLENRIWYNYPGQLGQNAGGITGTFDQPSLIGRVMPDGTTQLTQIAYNSQGNRTSITDPKGRQTLFDYASNGIDVTGIRQLTGTNTYTTIAQFTYNTQHQPLTYTDANNKTTTFTYNSAGQRLTATDPLGHVTTYQYDTLGNLTAVKDAYNVAIASFTYDSAGRVATRKDAANNTLTYQHDNFDRVTKVTYPDATYYQYTYNKLDLVSVRDRLGRVTQYSYDANRQLASTTDPAGHTTQYAYYPNGTVKTTTNALSGTVQRAYDIQARLTSLTDAIGAQTTFAYDVAGNRISENSPDSGLTQYVYDAANSIIKKTDALNIVSNYGYDAYKRLSNITYPASAGENATYVFDGTANNNPGMGRLTGFSNDGSTGSIAYDAVGNITSQSETIGAKSYTTQYQYDNNNRLSKIIYAPSGHIVTYVRNSLGQITAVQWQASAGASVQTIVSGVTYLPFGPMQSLTYGNGAVTTLQYDSDYRMTRSTTTSNPVRDIVYAYNSAGNITSLTDQSNTYTKTFSYDALNRLITDNNDAGQYSYQYDANGNRTQTTSVNSSGSGTVPITYTAGTNRMATINGLPVSYDANGNIVNEYGFLGFAYNNANRLTTSSTVAGTQTMVAGSYLYNALGRRVVNNTETHYLYTLDGKYLVKPQWGNGTVPFHRSEYIYLDNMPVAQIDESLNSNGTVASTTRTYIHADHLGTPRLMTDTTKKVVWRWEGDAFGQNFPIQSTDSTTGSYDLLDLRFPGQMADNGNTNYYNINRYYDPFVGGYTQTDPVGLEGGANRYAYVGANPISFIDTLGLEGTSPAPAPVNAGTGVLSPPKARYNPDSPYCYNTCYFEQTRSCTLFTSVCAVGCSLLSDGMGSRGCTAGCTACIASVCAQEMAKTCTNVCFKQ